MSLKIKANEKKSLQFAVQIGGIDPKELSGSLRVLIDGIEYGFPAEIQAESISISIPPLGSVIKRSLKDDELIPSKLEIHGNGFYMDPWKGEFQISNPVKVEAKMISEDEEKTQKKKIEVKIKDIETKDVEEDYIIPRKKSPITGKDRVLIADQEEENKEGINKLVEKKLKEMASVVDKHLSSGKPSTLPKKKKKLTESKETSNQPKKVTFKRPEKITKNDIHALMESRGMKNKRMQEALLERAHDMCFSQGSAEPDQEQLYDLIDKMLLVQRQ